MPDPGALQHHRRTGRLEPPLRFHANHTVYKRDTTMIPIPGHRDIGERMAVQIYAVQINKECQDVLGEDRWK